MHRNHFYIDGKWTGPLTDQKIDVVSPFTEEVVATVPSASPDDVDRAVSAARQAFAQWSTTPLNERIEALSRLADLYAARQQLLAETITTEMGSPISFSNMVQAPMPLGMLHYYLQLASGFGFEETRTGVLSDVVVRREPVGVVAAIVPWNVPQCVTMPKIAPALVAGCTVVLKPAPETPLDAYLLAEMADEAGLPPGVFNMIPAGTVGSEHLVSHPDVDHVAFTGSVPTGRRIGAICGDQLKRCSLELGGKSAAVVLEDADLDATIEGLRFASLLNSGQACVAQTRLLLPRVLHDEFVDGLCALVASMPVGDPMDPTTEVGPLVSARQRDRVEGYLRIGADEGAKAVIGGGSSSRAQGYFVEPTVFTGVDNGMRIAREEIFGPVLSVIPYDTDEEAIAIANDSPYGLAGSVWTTDAARGMEVASRVRTGTLGLNHYTMEFGAPFGGYKQSGLGREMGPEGLHEYLEDKSIAIPKP